MLPHLSQSLFILYVQDQQHAATFYKKLLNLSPSLNVPGMTEFTLSETSKLGLMPNQGIAKIIGDQLPNPSEGLGIPRCELYLLVEDISPYYNRALVVGAVVIAEPKNQDWGHRVLYLSDPDGHVIAFAELC